MRGITSFCAAWLLLSALAPAIENKEEKIALDHLPKAVLDAARARFPSADLKQAEKEVEGGRTLFEINLKHQGKTIDLTLTDQGTITEIETLIRPGDLPGDVTKAIKRKYGDSKIVRSEEIIDIAEGRETKAFEVLLVGTESKRVEAKFSTKGELLEEEIKDKHGED